MKGKKKWLVIIPAIILMVGLIIPTGVSFILYQSVFGKRYQTSYAKMNHTYDFDGLNRDKYELISDQGQKITAYNYFTDKEDVKGIIIMAHGIGGGGHNSYMSIANDFAQAGYYAFAYDVTGNDESEGSSVEGLPQGVIDLDHVISFVEQQEEFQGLPIGLFGHSWGGYSVVNSLNEHPEVSCVVSVAGFSKSSDLLMAQGRQMIGPFIYVLIPYIKAIDDIKFGKYASETGMDGLAQTDAHIMVVQGGQDTTVPQDYGYDLYYEVYGNDPNYVFVYEPSAGHNDILEDYGVVEKAIEFYNGNM